MELYGKKGIKNEIIKIVKEIYNTTKARVRVKDEFSEEIILKKGVRQGCPLSATLFNIAFRDLEEHIKQGQIGGVKVGKEKIYTIAYADDIALLATRENDMQSMMNRFGKYINKKGLELNASK